MKSSKYQPDITIVIPALREEKRIGKTLDELASYLKTDAVFKKLEAEVLVVSADSTDGTHEVVLSMAPKFKHLSLLKPGPPVGKGRDVQYGMLRAKGHVVVFMDADLATPLHHLPKFYETCLEGADVVIGTRNLRSHHPSVSRRLLSNAGNVLFRVMGGVWVEDSQCGFKMFSASAAQICFSRLTILGWGFDMEVLAIAKVNKLKIVSYRIDDWVSVPEGTFVTGAIKNALDSLAELGKIAFKRFSGQYAAKN